MAQANSLIGFAFVVDEKRELDAGSLAEKLGIAGIAQSNRSETRAFLLELGFKFAQLRDVLSAEDSTVVAQEDERSRPSLPQRAKARGFAVDIGERDPGQFAAE